MKYPSLSELTRLNNEVALVTGAGVGIGQACAKRLHEAGAKVAVVDLDESSAKRTADALNQLRPNSAIALQADVGSHDQVEASIAATVAAFGRITILVNNAGIFPFRPLADLDEQLFDRIVSTNLKSVFLYTKAVSAHMIEHKIQGRIINVASVDSLHPSMIGLSAYDASKHAVWGFTKSTALELASHGIRVNALAPGGILTPGVITASGGKVDPRVEVNIPMKRLGDPDEMGRLVVVLASQLSSYMTGSLLVADGGMLLT